MHFFISHLASWLRTAALASLLFPGASNHWKNTVFRDFPTFSRICIFFLLTLSLLFFSLLIFLFSLPLPCSAFHLHIVGSLTSKLPSAKLPSIIIIVIIIISPQLCGFLVFDSVSRASSASSASSHQLCHTPSFTHNNFTHHLSTTIFHTQ